MTQNKTSEQLFWDDCAQKRIYAAFDKEEYDRIFSDNLGNLEAKRVLDLGCASGISAILLALKGADVLGIDISPELIKQAQELSREIGKKIEFAVGDAERLDLPDNNFDVIFFGGVMHHFPQKEKLIAECRRILKKGGRILAIEPNYNDFFQRLNWKIARKRNLLSVNEDLVSPAELNGLLASHGFANVKISTFREHLSFLGLLFPKSRQFFQEHGETTWAEKILLFPINLFRPKIDRGNFLVIYAEKNN